MRYVVENSGKFLKVARKGWHTERQWVPLPDATTWAKPGHAKLAANLAGGRGLDVLIWPVVMIRHGAGVPHRARSPR